MESVNTGMPVDSSLLHIWVNFPPPSSRGQLWHIWLEQLCFIFNTKIVNWNSPICPMSFCQGVCVCVACVCVRVLISTVPWYLYRNFTTYVEVVGRITLRRRKKKKGSYKNSLSALLFSSCFTWEYRSVRHSHIPSCVFVFSIVCIWSEPFHSNARLARLPPDGGNGKMCSSYSILAWHRPLAGVILAAVRPSCPVLTNLFPQNISRAFSSTAFAKSQIEGHVWLGWHS